MVIHKPFTIVHNVTALSVVLHVAGVLLNDRSNHGHVFMRNRAFRFFRLTVYCGEVHAALAQVSSDYVFVRGDEALEVILKLGMVERVSMRPTCLPPTVSHNDGVTDPRTLAELAAGLMLGDAPAWAAE